MEKKTVKSSDLASLKDLKGRMAREHVKPIKDKMIMQEDLARQKAIVINDFLPVETLTKMLSSLPEDAKITNVSFDPMRNKKIIFVLSKDFALVEEGESIPEIKFSFDSKTGEVDGSFKEASGFLDALEDL